MADNRYRITERVAAGGMAEVFRGVAESLQGFKKNIAIKRILPSLTKNKKFVAMFLDEARLSLHLQHANIVQVFDIGHSDDTYFIVMEFVEGIDLKALVEWRRRIGKTLPVEQTLYIIMEMCKGLAYAHEMTNPDTGAMLNIVHRDVSPPNVLLSKNGEVKVVDFGLAKATSQIENTDPGVVKGKMSYLSPEAARGEEVDRRADVFAVGILLYEMLTGKRLFYGESDYQTVELVRNAKVPPIGAQNPAVEMELENIVRKALARRIDDRFQTATDLQDAIAHYLFSHGMKVIQRDISDLVRQCIEDRATQSGTARKAPGSLIDGLLQEEIVKFTSVESSGKVENPGAQPLSGVAVAAPAQLGGDFIDPRGWAEDLSTSIGRRSQEMAAAAGAPAAAPRLSGLRPTPAPAPEPAAAENSSIAAQAAAARTTGKNMRAVGSGPHGAAMGPTPGIENLARVLEPTPASAAMMAQLKQQGVAHKSSGTSKLAIFLIVGFVVLGAALTAMILKQRGMI